MPNGPDDENKDKDGEEGKDKKDPKPARSNGENTTAILTVGEDGTTYLTGDLDVLEDPSHTMEIYPGRTGAMTMATRTLAGGEVREREPVYALSMAEATALKDIPKRELTIADLRLPS